MHPLLLRSLRARRPDIRHHWEALLRAAPVSTPLGNPDALVHLIEWTLGELFKALGNPLAGRRGGRSRFVPAHPFECPCGRNPLVAYFAAGVQAMQEAMVLARAAALPLDRLKRDAAFEELNMVLEQTSRREIEAFCGVCQFRVDAGALAIESAVHA